MERAANLSNSFLKLSRWAEGYERRQGQPLCSGNHDLAGLGMSVVGAEHPLETRRSRMRWFAHGGPPYFEVARVFWGCSIFQSKNDPEMGLVGQRAGAACGSPF